MSQTMQLLLQTSRMLSRGFDMTDYPKVAVRRHLLGKAWTRTGKHLRGALAEYGQEQKHQSRSSE